MSTQKERVPMSVEKLKMTLMKHSHIIKLEEHYASLLHEQLENYYLSRDLSMWPFLVPLLIRFSYQMVPEIKRIIKFEKIHKQEKHCIHVKAEENNTESVKYKTWGKFMSTFHIDLKPSYFN